MTVAPSAAELGPRIEAAITLPRQSVNRMRPVEELLASLTDLAPEQIQAYVVSKAGNLNVRFTQPGTRNKPALGLAVITYDDRGHNDAATRRIVAGGGFGTIAHTVRVKGTWTVTRIFTTSVEVANRLRAAWPAASVERITRASSPDEAHEEASIDTGCFEGFERAAFEFLKDLGRNNNDAWYAANKDAYAAYLREPMRCFIDAVGDRIAGLGDLETEANARTTMSKLRKRQPDAEGPYYRWYWAAFYRRGRKKIDDAQLYVSLTEHGLSHGFYFGEGPGGRELLKRFRDLVSQHPDEVLDVLRGAGLLEGDLVFGGADVRGAGTPPTPVNDAESLNAWASDDHPRLGDLHRPDDPLLGDPSALVNHVVRSFERLYPVFALVTNTQDPLAAAHAVSDDPLPDQEDEPAPPTELMTLERVAEITSLELPFLERIDRVLRRKRQFVLQGPPGTGKTWLALHFAEYFAGHKDRVRVVQFHPSYAYEDFVEGIRARTVDVAGRAEIEYVVASGVFRELCEEAKRVPERSFVLVVDEINRGSVARIFGELLFLLEYRKRDVVLPYSKRVFRVPTNIYVIGTMNTADRSIALVDFALRRRFCFIDMAPQRAVLERWLSARKAPLLQVTLDLFDMVWKAIPNADYRIGTSFFMEHHTAVSLRDLWELELKPYLREFHFANVDAVDVVDAQVQKLLAGADRAEPPVPSATT